MHVFIAPKEVSPGEYWTYITEVLFLSILSFGLGVFFPLIEAVVLQ